jgi:WD40 repeat protein
MLLRSALNQAPMMSRCSFLSSRIRAGLGRERYCRRHSGYIALVVFLPDGQQVALGSDDMTVRFWDAATGAALQTPEDHLGWVTSVAFSPDANMTHGLSVLNDWVIEGERKLL